MMNPIKKRIGFYGGTFDPIHFGHLNLAIEMMERHALDEIWFCPAGFNPHKQDQLPTISTKHRMEMLKLAIQDIPQFHLLDHEVQKEGPSYTIDTLQTLIEESRKAPPKSLQLYLILGEDAIPGFFHWKQPDEIVKLVPLLIGRRASSNFSPELKGDPLICEAIHKGLTSNRIIEVSSTELRKRLTERRYCGHLVPAKVLDYIYAHDLYLGHTNQNFKP